jgi:hypothetical protein
MLSDLPKTWLIDIDGVIFPHNEYLTALDETPLPCVLQFFNQIPPDDRVILLSARKNEHIEQTRKQLDRWGIRYDELLFGLPVGERILINDIKPSGLETAYAVNLGRNEGLAGLASIEGRSRATNIFESDS